MASRALPAGIGCTLELGMRFARWASRLSALPAPEQVMREFAVSRATAFRYVDAYRNFASIDGDSPGLLDVARAAPKPLPSIRPRTWCASQSQDGMREAQTLSYVLLPMETPDPDPGRPNHPVVKGVRDRVGLHPSTIYAEIKAGRFPKPVKLGRSSRWVESEIDEYIAARMRERDQQGARSPSDKL